jgi:tetratricopeptide (TPR) repeat protein
MKRCFALLLGIAGLCVAGQGVARPSLWDVARDPKAMLEYETLVQIERLVINRAEGNVPDPDSADAKFPGTIVELLETLFQITGNHELPDVRLRFIYAKMLLNVGETDEALTAFPSLRPRELARNLSNYRKARDVLEKALATTPDSDLAAEGWSTLGIVCAHLGERDAERKAYDRALELEYDRGARANLLYNRGEARMARGDLKGAIADLRSGLALSRDPGLAILIRYAYGVALERSGDLPSGLEQMRLGSATLLPGGIPARSVFNSPSVFFSPDYEGLYYKALESMAQAKSAPSPAEAVLDYEAAITFWDSYLLRAEADGHRWFDHGRLLRLSADRSRQKLIASGALKQNGAKR